MDNVLFEQIRQFVLSERGRYRFPLTFQTTLEGDLRIIGDDAVEFIIAFGRKFNVDVSEFDLAAYFGGEGGIARTALPTPDAIPITLGNLYNAALSGIMYETDSFRSIIQFVKDGKWGFAGPFVRETDLYRHLKLRGEVAREFIDVFAKEFNVDVSEFEFRKYFPLKALWIFSSLFNALLRKKITLKDLETAVMKQKLV